MTLQTCAHFYVSGRVQGVGYRYFVLRVARELGLHGWVKNLDDGRVELVACAKASILAELERKLWLGPPAADVNDVERAMVPDPGVPLDFIIT